MFALALLVKEQVRTLFSVTLTTVFNVPICVQSTTWGAVAAAATEGAIGAGASAGLVGGPQTPVYFPSCEYDGIEDTSKALPRTKLVESLYRKVTNNRFVHLGAPAASGKTSLLQLLHQYAAVRGVTCIYVSMLCADFRTVLLKKTGIDASTWMLERDDAGRCVCADDSQQFVVMLDDAQRQYCDVNLWASLIKTAMVSDLPKNIRFVISATYSLHTVESPLDFALLPKLVRSDFLLSPEEVNDFINLSSRRLGTDRAGPLLVEPQIRQMLATHCNGHIGALSVSMKEIVKYFYHYDTVTVEDIVRFYLSKTMSSLFHRCFSCGLGSLPEQMRACLVKSLTDGPLYVMRDEDSVAYGTLVRSGVLVETEDGLAKFASRAAASYMNDLIFPLRSRETICQIKERGVFGLMKSVLAHMSGTTLKQSVVNPASDMPSETTFQHLMLAGLEWATPPQCWICPEISKYFPPPLSLEMDVDQVDPLPEVKGRCDYYLNSDLRWAIEVLISGTGVGEHLARLVGEGKYVGLGFADYLVVDFRVNATGEPSDVERHKRRMSVFFKQNDFTFCNVLCGLEPDPEKIDLAN